MKRVTHERIVPYRNVTLNGYVLKAGVAYNVAKRVEGGVQLINYWGMPYPMIVTDLSAFGILRTHEWVPGPRLMKLLRVAGALYLIPLWYLADRFVRSDKANVRRLGARIHPKRGV